MMGRWWSVYNLRQASEKASLLPSTSSSAFSPRPHEFCNAIPMSSWSEEDHELPQTWSQLLMAGGLPSQEERCSLNTPFQPKNLESSEIQLIYQSQEAQIKDLMQENFENSCYKFSHESPNSWSQIVTVSPRSCNTSSFSSNMLNFSNKKAERKSSLDYSECYTTENGRALKKARFQESSLSQPSSIKVRKEKLGDRITALHQLVSPFGKTDTASVLLEVFGYIRFLQSQIEALSSPYLDIGSRNKRQPVEDLAPTRENISLYG